MNQTQKILMVALSFTFGFAQIAQSAEKSDKQVATLTQIVGRTQIFNNPSKSPYPEKSLKAGTMALFEGQYYAVQDAKVGDRLDNGIIIRTMPDGQARVVYDNGDQFYLAQGTSYRVTWDKESETKIQLMYGRLRGVISKEGPRKHLTIKTHAATMGVRGTDFFIADEGVHGETEISVLRGAVEVEANGKDAKASEKEVKTGMSATVVTGDATVAAAATKTGETKAEPKTEPRVEIRQTTKEDLSGIQKASTVNVTASAAPSDPKLAQLEKKAIEVTSKDIERYQPALFKQISPTLNQVTNSQELNSKLVEMVAVNAPSAPKKRRKPNITELQDTDQGDVYDKYFKIGE